MIVEHAANTKRILVVDDSESNLYVVSTWLRRAGYDVAEARVGAEALELLATQSFDLAVIDVHLPDMSGYTVCERIKADRGWAGIPVLHISSTAIDTSDRSEGLRRGAEGYLVEPVEREELIATVESLLRAASAQRTAVKLSQRLQRLNDATFVLSDAPELRTLVAAIAQQAALLFDSTAAVASMLDGNPRLILSSPQLAVQSEACAPNAIQELLFAARTADEMDAGAVHALFPALPPTGRYLLGTLTGEPGVFLVRIDETVYATLEDVAILTAFSRSASTALRNMRSYDTERGIALKLQQNLLPDAVPSVPGLEIVTRYAAGAAHVEVGGDFYEIFALDETSVAIAIGDVVGHSLDAAMIMAQLRTAIRCFTLEGHPPDVVLERLDQLLRTFHPEVSATVCCGIYDIATGRFEYANAGHVPAMHGSREGWSFLPLGGTLLGVEAPPPPVQSLNLNAGETLLLYTDGLVERRGEDIGESLQRLARIASESTGLSTLCDTLLEQATNNDDVALVAIRRA